MENHDDLTNHSKHCKRAILGWLYLGNSPRFYCLGIILILHFDLCGVLCHFCCLVFFQSEILFLLLFPEILPNCEKHHLHISLIVSSKG